MNGRRVYLAIKPAHPIHLATEWVEQQNQGHNILRKLLYRVFVRNKVVDSIAHPAVSMVIPPLVGLYYGTLDIWGNEWDWIKNQKDLHGFLFTMLAGATILTLFMKGIAEAGRGQVSKRYQALLESMIQFFNGLVKKKRDRFFNRAKNIKPTADVFKIITHPKDQLQHALDGTRTFLVNGFGVEQKNIGITVIQGEPSNNKWWYCMKCDSQKQHTLP